MTEPDVAKRTILLDTPAMQMREIELHPGQMIEPHVHNCPVYGYVLEGALLLQAGDQAGAKIEKGEAFHEPQGALISQFGAADGKPVKFVACFVLNGATPTQETVSSPRAKIGFSKT